MWSSWFFLSLQLARFQTLTMRSQPQETMTGLLLLGEKRTQETQSVWPSSYIKLKKKKFKMVSTKLPSVLSLYLNGVLALGQSVPQLDGLVPAARNNLTIISREGNTQDILKNKLA